MKKYKDIIIYALIIIGVILFRIYIATPVVVSGLSMDSTLKDGDVLILNKRDTNYAYGDIVVAQYKNEEIIKRVIGVPGDSIEYKDGLLYVNGSQKEDKFSSITKNFSLSTLGYETIPDGYYLLLGDNRTVSLDSRLIGLVKKEDIKGTIAFRIYPLNKIGNVK